MENSDRNLDEIRQQAQSETTDQNTLCRLAHNREQEIRGYVAANPNTPMDMLKILGREFPQVVIQNPVFKKLLAEQPEDEFVRLSLARISTTPTEKLEPWSGLKNQTASFYLALADGVTRKSKRLRDKGFSSNTLLVKREFIEIEAHDPLNPKLTNLVILNP